MLRYYGLVLPIAVYNITFQDLFSKVREGEVRILLGSTQKMGAGTNVQKKLVALHDIDWPWRPSDIGQRERADFFGIMPYSQEFEFYK